MTFLFEDEYHKTFSQITKESGFKFNLYRGRIDWKKLDNLDVDRIVRDIDMEVLNSHINNVINCNLDAEYDVKILDPNFVKLFRIAQLTIDFLLHCKHYLERQLNEISVGSKSLKREVEELRKNLHLKKLEIKQLKKKLKDKIEKEKYSHLVSRGLQARNIQCKICGKLFVDEPYLRAHQVRRHAGQCLTETIDHTSFLQQEIKLLKDRLHTAELKLRDQNYERAEKEVQAIEKTEEVVGKKYELEIQQLKEMFFTEMQKLKQNTIKVDVDGNILQNRVEEYSNQIVDTKYSTEVKTYKPIEDTNQETKSESYWESKLEARESVWRTRLSVLDQEHKQEVQELREKLKTSCDEGLRLKDGLQKAVQKIEEKEIQVLNQEIPVKKEISVHSEFPVTQKQVKVVEREISIEKEFKQNIPQPPPIVKRKAFVYQKTLQNEIDSTQKANMAGSGDIAVDGRNNRVDAIADLGKQIETKIITLVNKSSDSVLNKSIDRTLSISNDSVLNKSVDSTVHKSNGTMSVDEDKSKNGLNEVVRGRVDSTGRSKVQDIYLNTSDEMTDDSESTIQDKSQSSESDSQEGVATMHQQLALQSLQSMEEILASNPEILQELKTELVHLLEKRLQDLGIDAEWRGVPNKTFKNKMAVLKHHQKVTAKGHIGYFTLRDHLLHNLEERCDSEPDKRKPMSKENIMTRLHTRAAQVLALAKKENSKVPAMVVKVKEAHLPTLAHEEIIGKLTIDTNMLTSAPVLAKDCSTLRSTMDPTLTRTRSEFVLSSSSDNEEKSLLATSQPVRIYKSALRSASSTGNLAKKKVVFLDELFSGNKKSFSDDMMNITTPEDCATPRNSATSVDRIQSPDKPDSITRNLANLDFTSVVHSTPRSHTLQLPKAPSPASSLTSIGSSLLDISPTEDANRKNTLEWNLEDIEENLKSD